MKKKFGLIGEKLSHSISPQIHKEIFNYFSINGDYNLFEISKNNFKKEIDTLIKSGLSGFNVTIPYKIDIMDHLNYISKEAKAIGAVNTVHINNGQLHGYNTDYFGIALTFEKFKINLCNSSAVILGSGGSAAAVVQYLQDNNCFDITFVVRNKEKAINNFRIIKHNIVNYDELNMLNNKDILINCTPCGMYPLIDECPVPSDYIKNFKFIFDLIYNPPKTLLLKYAKDLNILNCNGLYMLVGQALYSEKIWNNINFNSNLTFLEKIYNILENR